MSDILSPQGFEPNEALETTDIQEVYQPTSGGIRRNKQVTLGVLRDFFKKLTSFTANNIVESSADGTLRTTTISTASVSSAIALSANNANRINENINQGVKTGDTPLFEDVTITGMTGSVESRIESNTSAISSNDSDISTLQSRVTSNDNDISTLDSRVDGNDSDISTLQSRVDGNDSDISTLDGRVDGNDTDIATLQGRVTSNDSDIATLESKVGQSLNTDDEVIFRSVEVRTNGNAKLTSIVWASGTAYTTIFDRIISSTGLADGEKVSCIGSNGNEAVSYFARNGSSVKLHGIDGSVLETIVSGSFTVSLKSTTMLTVR